jgi:hypothetical protein
VGWERPPDCKEESMKAVRCAAAFLLVSALVAPGLCGAARNSDPKVGFFVHGGYGTYAMSDINDDIQAGNAELADLGLKMDEINGGLNFGGGIRFMVNENISLSGGFERLFGSSELSVSGASVKFKVPANAITATGEYFLPMEGPLGIGFGGGVGYYISAAGSESTILGANYSEDWKGSGFGLHGLVLGRIAASPAIQVDGALGYRFAVAKDIEIGGDSTLYDLDWSGLMTRLGLTVYLNPAQ